LTVYLLHFDRPYRHARHYLGFVDGGQDELETRIDRHHRRDGARLLAVVREAGIEWVVARTWPGATRKDERRLKRRKCGPRLCPLCSAGERRVRSCRNERNGRSSRA